MADVTQSAAEIVNDKYNRSVDLANQASAQVAESAQSLRDSVYTPPTFSMHWQMLPAPVLPPIPDLPALPDVPLDIPTNTPSELQASMPGVAIDGFDVLPPTLDFPVAPVLTIGTAPALPEVRDVAVPDAPLVTLPDAPAFLSLTTHTFSGINLHEGWLDKLDDIPTLTLIEPAPFAYSPGQRYASQLLSDVKATLLARLSGGTGLAPAVEQAIFDRAREREDLLGLGREHEALRGAEALGFPLPPGVMLGQLADVRRERQDKVSGLSRDIMLKQAEMEQANLERTIQFALQLETVLLEDAYKLEMMAFEVAKSVADNAIAAHNARIEHFKALLAGYQAYASAYDTLIKAELSKVEAYKAMLSAEQTKADINKSLVDRYKAEIEGSMAVVEIYRARVGAAQTLVELEKARIQAGAEQVRAFVATVSAETAKADLYKTGVEAQAAKQQAYNIQVQAYGHKASAQAEVARANIARYQALISAKGLEWDGYRARVNAASAAVEAAARKSSIIVDGYRVGAAAAEAQAGSYMRRWEADIKQYEAGQSITFQVARMNTDAVLHTNDARMEAAKVMLTSDSQRLASAWAMVGANASISGSATLNQTI